MLGSVISNHGQTKSQEVILVSVNMLTLSKVFADAKIHTEIKSVVICLVVNPIREK